MRKWIFYILGEMKSVLVFICCMFNIDILYEEFLDYP